MAFLSYTDLIQATIRRLRQVTGQATQLYSQDEIARLIVEQYEIVRSERWWDHLMSRAEAQLDGTTGQPTVGFAGAREGFRDIQAIYYRNISTQLPQLTRDVNPYRLTGTYPRFVEPLAYVDDDVEPRKLFRIWPLGSVTTVDTPIRVLYRRDPTDLFTDNAVVVPFDSSTLINMSAARYLAQDGTNPGAVGDLNNTALIRLDQLRKSHDNTVIMLDQRTTTPGLNEWAEER
jgi:hypothetical protein